MPRYALTFALAAACSTGAAASDLSRLVVFVSALGNDAIVRMEDRNGDGTFNGPEDTTIFFGPGNASGFPGSGSAQSILVLSETEVLAADGEGSGGFTKRVYRLRDMNGDGTSMGAGEAIEYWDGILPGYGGANFDRPKEMWVGPDGAIYLADNNTINFDNDSPEAIWRLEDLNGDGTVNNPGEVTLHLELAPPDMRFAFISEDFKLNSKGQIYFSNQTSSTNTTHIWIIEPDKTLRPFLSADDLFGLDFQKTGMTLHPETENPVVAGWDIAGNRRIMEFVDLDGNGMIDDNSEVQFLYRQDLAATPASWGIPSSVMDVEYAPDGSLFVLDVTNDRIWRLVDLDGDGTFNGPGEVSIVYQASVAAANGGVEIDFPRTIGFVLRAIPGDLTGDGNVGSADLAILLGSWGPCPPAPDPCSADLSGDGAVGSADLAILLGNWGAGR
ncbi:MAG: hypothetical protein EA376_09570 [Phycisphaeraceae bacterium]|nr:MAG: hypothetical protein EA376_09570 [Phycisphaeraceae bacterium]